MAYGEIKVDSITFTANGSDATVSVSGLVQNPTFSGDITVTGTISGDIVQGGTLVSGATVSGTAGEFGTITGNTAGFTTVTGTTVTGTTVNAVSGVFTTQVSGATVTGNTGQFTNITGGAAGFTSVTGTTVTGTTANFTSGVFTTQISGTTITGNAGQFSTLTGGTAGFTTITGTTVTGTTANFVTVSGTTVTGGNGNFTAVTTTTANVTSGVFASGTAAAPSVSVGTTDNGIYSPDTDQVAISTSGTGRLFVDAGGNVGVGVNPPSALVHISSSYATPSTGGINANTRLIVSNNNLASSEANISLLYRSNAKGRLNFGSQIVEDVAYVEGGVNYLAFGTGSGTASAAERLRITSTGQLSHIGSGSSGSPAVGFNGSAPSNSLVIDSTGRLGVGTSSPGYKLDVNGEVVFSPNTAGKNTFYFTTNASNDASLFLKSDTTDKVNIQANGTSYFNGGNVGIGTSTVSDRVEIANGTTDAANALGIRSGRYLNAAQEGAQLKFYSDQTTSWLGTREMARIGTYGLSSDHRIGSLAFFLKTTNSASNPSEMMRLTPTGLGIGTTSPVLPLHIATGTATTGRQRIQSGDGANSNRFYVDIGFNTGLGASNDFGISAIDTLNGANTGPALIFGTQGIYTGATATERARIDSYGRLLVGTSSSSTGTEAANCKLTVAGNTVSGLSGAGLLNLQKGTAATSTSYVGRVVYSDNTHDFAYIDSVADGSTTAGRLVFSTTADGASSPTERMRIRNNGVISTFNSVGDSLNIYNGVGAGTTNGLIYGLHSATNNVSGGTICFIVYTNGNVVNTNNSYGAYSDIKLKENIVDANSQWGDIKALQVRNYNFKEGQTHTQLGLIAQEVELVSPGLVSESPDRDEDGNDLGTVTKSVNYSVLYMKAVKALQEAMERIETLEASNTDLMARVSALESA